ncbi:uncharacterized protein LOC119829744 isoform X2 [Zerene cesonia]|uniref:uncharacterized protein LOC119829744 isoform X2 n=1 Tax=Zerene cesonia TaxID=33412 RepID=UPI0018E518D8|nr:uncharacterized protein LOC119829744 isoform X2 [Zerene cesonia]
MGFRYTLCFLTIASVHAINQYQNNQYQNNYANFARNQAYQRSQIPQIAMPNIPPLIFPNFAPMPPFSPQDLINRQLGPGSNYNGVAISSSSSSKTDQYGNIVSTGGTKIITNDNGLVKEYNYGDAPNTNIIYSSPFAPIPPIKPVNPEIISRFKPGQNEEFQGRSIMTSYHESNINGAKTGGGIATIIDNDNGRVQQKTYKYGDLKDDYDV